jgi:hypothetical protein
MPAPQWQPWQQRQRQDRDYTLATMVMMATAPGQRLQGCQRSDGDKAQATLAKVPAQ